jgi:hypothetical protein
LASLQRFTIEGLHLGQAYTGRQLRAQETGVSGLVCDAANSGQPKIDRRRRVSALFELDPVPELWTWMMGGDCGP